MLFALLEITRFTKYELEHAHGPDCRLRSDQTKQTGDVRSVPEAGHHDGPLDFSTQLPG